MFLQTTESLWNDITIYVLINVLDYDEDFDLINSTMSTLTAMSYYSVRNLEEKTPKRYFTLGVLCCCISGFVFFAGIILMVWGSSPHEPEAIWIAGIVFLLFGGVLFFMGVSSIGIYLSKEDKRKRDLERARTRYYASSISSGRSLRSSDVYLIDWAVS